MLRLDPDSAITAARERGTTALRRFLENVRKPVPEETLVFAAKNVLRSHRLVEKDMEVRAAVFLDPATGLPKGLMVDGTRVGSLSVSLAA